MHELAENCHCQKMAGPHTTKNNASTRACRGALRQQPLGGMRLKKVRQCTNQQNKMAESIIIAVKRPTRKSKYTNLA